MVKKTALKIRLLKTKRNTKEKMKNVSKYNFVIQPYVYGVFWFLDD